MRFKRSAVALLMFMLMFSSSVSGAILPEKSPSTKGEENRKTIQEIKKSELDKQYSKTDIVRVIVEMKTEPSVLYAQKQKRSIKNFRKQRSRS
ncbi:hypothetical protein M5V91_17635 [Cytobacillus pseudoceanisediminis]|uniref:hypothetical protein n=1 Tax=Cytobacillus pseudoceanisediminis TaxID=3051614 RepID=UPI002188E604|nr:hypothetical protein [Cytobacillus pseudoceanisediminis]UQX52773.1 hypothetical protein M5V91_17635 [Cytobacillus pseudoceanisediminis]